MLCVLRAWFAAAVIREFEKCDFFDHGITKAHLFLTLHDAVLYALSRKAPDNSELSVDEGETVIQETYTESDKVGHCGAQAGGPGREESPDQMHCPGTVSLSSGWP